jgi:pyridinium-3,5-biscarboxylic acid mononucleotide sulfurtransferase
MMTMRYDSPFLNGCIPSTEIENSEDTQQDPLTRPIQSPRLRELAERVGAVLANHSPLGVAFSGGVDSTLLLTLAARQLGWDKVVAVIGVSPSLAHRDREQARRLAADLGVRCIDVHTREHELLAYRRNNRDRCYYCKDELFRTIEREVVEKYGLVAVAYGETAEDVSRGNRPGARAAKEHDVLRPLANAGLIKIDLRELAYVLGLPNWNKPAAPCLATRIPHSIEVTPEKLGQVVEA